MYNELVYNLDLCILSYQLYGQTLIWPMDPYYEQMNRRGASRRKTFIRQVNKLISKPGQDSNVRLDPILFNYDQINPWLPAIVKPENKWDVFNAPQELTKTIKSARTISNELGSPSKLVTNPAGIAEANDELYCFEGKTGGIPVSGKVPEKEGANSFMGFVIARKIDNSGNYDVHIVFRGSRSGSAERAFFEGKFSEMGNPDWVTDTDFGVLVKSEVSSIGKACRGFQLSVMQTKDNIKACLNQIQEDRKREPQHIYVTGHSLGGALACHYASLLKKGEYNAEEKLKNWPFAGIKVFTYGAPVTGDKEFCEHLGVNIPIVRVLIAGDLITQQKFNMQGWPIRTQQTHAGIILQLAEADKKTGTFEKHEPSFIRRALIAWLKKRTSVDDIPANTGDLSKRNDEPWAICDNFIDVLKHPAFKGANAENFTRILPGFNQSVIAGGMLDPGTLHIYTSCFVNTLGYAGAYKNPNTTNETKKKKQDAVEGLLMSPGEALDLKAFEDQLKKSEKDLNDTYSHKLIALCGILSRLIKKPADAADLLEGRKYPLLNMYIKQI